MYNTYGPIEKSRHLIIVVWWIVVVVVVVEVLYTTYANNAQILKWIWLEITLQQREQIIDNNVTRVVVVVVAIWQQQDEVKTRK